MTEQEIDTLYQQLANLTNQKCGKTCSNNPPKEQHRCCDSYYCELSHSAQQEAGLETIPYLPTDERINADIPYLSKDKYCIVPPRLRPLCTAHNCKISYELGYDPEDPQFTKEYFRLRNKIEEQEPIF